MSVSDLPMQTFTPQAMGALSGVRVIDMSRLVAGNMLSLQLADFGADVVKIEPAGKGDTLRHWTEPVPGEPAGFDGWWQAYGRNKRSLAMNLRSAQALTILRLLIRSADVLIESFRPGTLEAMGLDPADLLADTPGLVIVRLSGWGQSGPYRELPGFGSLIEGFSGYAARHADVDGKPVLPNLALADMITGLSGSFAVLAALRAVSHGAGRGQVIDLSLLEPMLSVMGPQVTLAARRGRAAPPPSAKIASPRGVYRCQDGGWVALSGSTDTMARRVFDALGRPGLAEDPRFSTHTARLAHDAELDALLQDAIGALDRADCLARFRAAGVTVGPVNDAHDLLEDTHVQARGVFVQTPVPGRADPLVTHAITPRLSGTPGQWRRPAPRCGEHSEEILTELGLSASRIEALLAEGHIATCP